MGLSIVVNSKINISQLETMAPHMHSNKPIFLHISYFPKTEKTYKKHMNATEAKTKENTILNIL